MQQAKGIRGNAVFGVGGHTWISHKRRFRQAMKMPRGALGCSPIGKEGFHIKGSRCSGPPDSNPQFLVRREAPDACSGRSRSAARSKPKDLPAIPEIEIFSEDWRTKPMDEVLRTCIERHRTEV